MTNGNDLAFPSSKEYSEGGTDFLDAPVIIQRESFGLTKREYFAAMAMQSILTYSKNHISRIASDSIAAADALINELNKPTS